MQKSSHSVGSSLDVRVERVVARGLGFARDSSGRVVLVDGGLPGERVAARVVESKARLVRAEVRDVLEPALLRRIEPCVEVAAGCGGCDLQHVDASAQAMLKAAIVADSLAHVGKIRGVPILLGRRLPEAGYRTTVRCVVEDATGRLGFRRRRSNEAHAVDGCLVAHPLVQEVIREARFPGAAEVTIRAGGATGERLVVVDGAAREVAEGVPEDVVLVDASGAKGNPDAHYHEVVCGRRFRVSARSFFQSRRDGAEALVDSVRRAIGVFDPGLDRLVDLYGGVGLFTGALGAERSVVVERSRSSSEDAKVNLADLGSTVVGLPVEKWRPTEADVVIADPARTGLDKSGVTAIEATGADRVALVSCDPASLARDAAMLISSGFELLSVELVDMFPNTHHIETVAALRRRA